MIYAWSIAKLPKLWCCHLGCFTGTKQTRQDAKNVVIFLISAGLKLTLLQWIMQFFTWARDWTCTLIVASARFTIWAIGTSCVDFYFYSYLNQFLNDLSWFRNDLTYMICIKPTFRSKLCFLRVEYWHISSMLIK